MIPNKADSIEVAVAVIVRGEMVLLAKRPQDKMHGGLWEFPGGKFESGESLEQALKREVAEELGIEVRDQTALVDIRHRYPDYSVILRVALVTEFSGEAHGRENQEIAWVPSRQLTEYSFPDANQAILQKLAEVLPS